MFKKVLLFGGHEIPIDDDELPYIIEQMAKNKMAICRKGMFSKSGFNGIIEDVERAQGLNRTIDKKREIYQSTSKMQLTDGFSSIRKMISDITPNKPTAPSNIIDLTKHEERGGYID